MLLLIYGIQRRKHNQLTRLQIVLLFKTLRRLNKTWFYIVASFIPVHSCFEVSPEIIKNPTKKGAKTQVNPLLLINCFKPVLFPPSMRGLFIKLSVLVLLDELTGKSISACSFCYDIVNSAGENGNIDIHIRVVPCVFSQNFFPIY